jgi:hypothetical protein
MTDPAPTNTTMMATNAIDNDTSGSIADNGDMVPGSTFPYFGGKGGFYQRLINLMPPHDIYIETHLGGGAVIRNKRPAKINIAIDIDPVAHRLFDAERFKNIGFVQGDAIEYLKKYYANERTLIYCDPPYLLETRKSGKRYNFEFTTSQHVELLKTLKQLSPCLIMISGYWSQLYGDELSGWNKKSFQVATRGGQATEWVWFNFDEPAALHDYKYLGDTFRDRERIKRKHRRWINNLKKMPVLERLALLEKVENVFD